MASKHSNNLPTLVIRHYQKGDLLSKIAAKTLPSLSTVQYMVDKYKLTKCIDHLFGRARKRETNRLVQRKLKLYRRKSASMVKIEIENERWILLHVDTIRKRAHEVGRVARKKPYVNKINRGKRLKFAKKMFEKSVSFWKNVVGSDESKFNLFGSDGKVMVWRTPCEEFHPKCTIPTVKHGGSSVMIWGCFTCQRVGKLCVLWTDFTIEIFWNTICNYHSIILN